MINYSSSCCVNINLYLYFAPIRSHPGGRHDPGLGRHRRSEGFGRSSPTQIAGEVLRGDPVKASHPFFQSAMVSVHIVDVMLGGLRSWVARRRQDVNIELGAAGE